MKIIEAVWFSTPKVGALGIVCFEDDLGEKKFVLGVGQGYNQKEDVVDIIDWGAKLDPDYVMNFFNRHLKT